MGFAIARAAVSIATQASIPPLPKSYDVHSTIPAFIIVKYKLSDFVWTRYLSPPKPVFPHSPNPTTTYMAPCPTHYQPPRSINKYKLKFIVIWAVVSIASLKLVFPHSSNPSTMYIAPCPMPCQPLCGIVKHELSAVVRAAVSITTPKPAFPHSPNPSTCITPYPHATPSQHRQEQALHCHMGSSIHCNITPHAPPTCLQP